MNTLALQYVDPFSPLRLRHALRAGRLYALLDATSFDQLGSDLQASGLPHSSLFFGDDAVMLREEAPYLVALTVEDMPIWGEILRRARTPYAGMLCVTGASLDELRRHWKKWISVHIPDEEALVLFRFFDARIALAFMATLGPADAAAFFGPIDALITKTATSTQKTERTLPAPATRVGAGKWYQMTPVQMLAFSEVAGEAYRGRYLRYMRQVWPELIKGLSDAELAQKLDEALTTADRLGIPRDMSAPVNLVIVSLIAPDVLEDAEFFLDQFKSQMPAGLSPSGYPNALLTVAEMDLTPKQAEYFFEKVQYWVEFK
ncbi:MAG: DUF4123 domain-containing protein [Maritimibacter sp.]